MIPAWVLALGAAGTVVVVAAAAKKPKPRPGIDVDLPDPPSPAPALPAMTQGDFNAELAARFTRLADAAAELGLSWSDLSSAEELFGTSWGQAVALGLRNVDDTGVISGPKQSSEYNYDAGDSVWNAFGEFYFPEERARLRAFAEFGHAQLQKGLPPRAQQFKYVPYLNDPKTAKRRIARAILGESSDAASAFG